MKDLFSPHTYFNLSQYAHAALLTSKEVVWEILPLISSYIKNQVLGKIEVEIPAGAFLVNPELISIGKGTIVEPGAYIKGPCVIGQNCSIRHGAYIRGDVITGNHCIIGHDTEMKNTIMLDTAYAGHFAYLGDSILGNHVNLGAGTKCANLRLDNREIIIHVEGREWATGLRKFGAVIGDGVQTGCNSVLNPGTLVGKYVACYPCTNFGGIVPAHTTVKTDAEVLFVPHKKK